MASVRGVELGRALEGVREPAEHLAHGGRAGGKRPRGRVPVEVAPAGDRPLAPNVEGGERVHLPGIRLADDHPELLRHVGIGGRRLHAAVFEGRPRVPVEIGQHGGGLDGVRGKAQRHHRAHGARRLGDRGPVLGDEQAGHPVVGAHALDVVLDDRDAGRPPGLDGRVQLLDRRLVQAKRLVPCATLCDHDLTSLAAYPTAFRTLPPASTGLAAIRMTASTHGWVPRLTQLWIVPRWTMTSPALR